MIDFLVVFAFRLKQLLPQELKGFAEIILSKKK